MKYIWWFFLFVLFGCNESPRIAQQSPDTSFISNDTIPEMRKKVSAKPVATYVTGVNDPKLGRQFKVTVFETAFTFRYLLRMQYEEVIQTDTLKIPNFGVWPSVEVRPGKDKRTVIIGFLDKKKQFKEYKSVSAYGNRLKLTTLKRYDVGVYRKS